MATAPAIVRLVGGSVHDALATTRRMREITLAENPRWTIPVLDFVGAPTGIDVSAVCRTGILPQINTGMAGKVAGTGQVGAGLVTPPAEVFPAALSALASSRPTDARAGRLACLRCSGAGWSHRSPDRARQRRRQWPTTRAAHQGPTTPPHRRRRQRRRHRQKARSQPAKKAHRQEGHRQEDGSHRSAPPRRRPPRRHPRRRHRQEGTRQEGTRQEGTRHTAAEPVPGDRPADPGDRRPGGPRGDGTGRPADRAAGEGGQARTEGSRQGSRPGRGRRDGPPVGPEGQEVEGEEVLRDAQPSSAAAMLSATGCSSARPVSRKPVTTPSRSASERFWLSFALPSTFVTVSSMPTIPRSCPST